MPVCATKLRAGGKGSKIAVNAIKRGLYLLEARLMPWTNTWKLRNSSPPRRFLRWRLSAGSDMHSFNSLCARNGGVRTTVQLLIALLVFARWGFSEAPTNPNLSVREARYLFLDLLEVDQMQGLVQAINQGEKYLQNPVMEGTPGTWDHPRLEYNGTVMFDQKTDLWRMWYSGTEDEPAGLGMTGPTDTRHVGYATSHDGIHWTKPNLGVIDYLGSKENNLVVFDGQAATVIDLRGKLPGKRYRMYVESFGGTPAGSINFHWFRSDDGVHWDDEGHVAEKDLPIEPANVIYDPDDPNPERRWKAYALLMDMRFPARKLGVVTSPDGQKWSQPTIILHPADGLEDEDHYLGVTKYQDYYIALYDFMYRGHNTDTELAVSRDGIHFSRILNGHTILPLGKKGEFDSSMICIGKSFLTMTGKHYLYYTGSDKNYQEGSSRSGLGLPWRRSIGLATWRQDGFTDLQLAKGEQIGWLLTKPIKVTTPGSFQLWVNADIPSPGTQLQIEVLDGESGRPIQGYEHADSLSGINDLEQVITWRGRDDLSGIHSSSIRLRFTLAGPAARLYSFGFRKLGENSHD